ncbi:MAG: transposase [Paludibacteraceae bacterium]
MSQSLPDRKTVRLCDYDYAEGEYFVTICTEGRVHYFGEIEHGEIQLTKIGEYLKMQIEITEKLRVGAVEIPCYVIMPNHVHLIIIINARRDALNASATSNAKHTDARSASLQFGPQRGNLASVVAGIKSAVTRFANENNVIFAWQQRFYEHVVRSSTEMNRIAEYIEQNPYNWATDEYNTDYV